MFAGVTSQAATLNLRRKYAISPAITVSNGVAANLTGVIASAPPGSRIAVTGIDVICSTAVSNHAMGTLKVGVHDGSNAAYTNDDAILESFTPAVQYKALGYKLAYDYSDFASTLKTAPSTDPELCAYPIVPAGYDVVHTAGEMAASGTGAIRIGVSYFELDDE